MCVTGSTLGIKLNLPPRSFVCLLNEFQDTSVLQPQKARFFIFLILTSSCVHSAPPDRLIVAMSTFCHAAEGCNAVVTVMDSSCVSSEQVFHLREST
jgi:hypothetical protein